MKDKINNWQDVFTRSFSEFWDQFIELLPTVLGAILIMLIGWLLARFLSKLTLRVLTRISNTKMSERFKSNLDPKSLERIVNFISRFIYWVVILLFLIIVSEALGWQVVSKEIGLLFRYLPKLFSGVIIFIIGLYIAGIIRDILSSSLNSLGVAGSGSIALIAYYVVVIFTGITAINQAGIDTSIINQNITLIIGAILLSFAVSFAIASRNLIENFISGTYARNNIKLGIKIKIHNIEGIVESIDSTTISVRSATDVFIIPLKDLSNSTYQILDAEEA